MHFWGVEMGINVLLTLVIYDNFVDNPKWFKTKYRVILREETIKKIVFIKIQM